MKNKHTLLIAIALTLFPLFSFSQNYLFTNTNTLKYFAAKSEPDPAWFTPGFNDSAWPEDTAVIGFGYGTAGYTVIDSTANSLYVRFSFNIENKANVKILNFSPDYDDGFIAYLNGFEVARVNADKSVQYPPYNAIATRSHASEFMLGKTPVDRTVLGIYLDSTVLKKCLMNGENIMAVHVINDGASKSLMFIPILIDIPTDYNAYSFYHFDSRYKRLIDVDSTNLPLVSIETDRMGIPYDESIWTTAHMGIVNNGEGKFNKLSDPYTDYNGLVSIRLRGQSSHDFPKQTYRVKLVDNSGADTSFVLMGMPKESDWVLFGPFTDKSLIRNKFVYDLGARIGQSAPRSRFCEVVLNGQTIGLYILTETIKRDKNRVNISKMTDKDINGNDVTGGYIFKYDKWDVNMNWSTNGREIVYPDPLQDEQKNYITRFFTAYDSILMGTNDFLDPVKGFRKYASDSSLVDNIIINEITKNSDAYLYSTYMYKDRDDKDGRMKFGPLWDYDLCFGNTIFQNANIITGWQFETNTTLNITRYFQDIKFVKLFQDRWHELRVKTLSNDSILSLFDQMVDQVKLASKRNYEVWPIIDKNLFFPNYYVNSYENEINTIKNWLTIRLEWIDNNVDKIYYPLKRVGNNQLASNTGDLNLKVFPNPFESEMTLNFSVDKESTVRIELYNMTGQLQHQVNWKNVSGNVNFVWNDSKLASLQKGMYLAKIFVNGIPGRSFKITKR